MRVFVQTFSRNRFVGDRSSKLSSTIFYHSTVKYTLLMDSRYHNFHYLPVLALLFILLTIVEEWIVNIIHAEGKIFTVMIIISLHDLSWKSFYYPNFYMLMSKSKELIHYKIYMECIYFSCMFEYSLLLFVQYSQNANILSMSFK